MMSAWILTAITWLPFMTVEPGGDPVTCADPDPPGCSSGDCAGQNISFKLTASTSTTNIVRISVCQPPPPIAACDTTISFQADSERNVVCASLGGCTVCVNPCPGLDWGSVCNCSDVCVSCESES